LRRALPPLVWLLAFVAIVSFIVRGYPLALSSRPERSLAVTLILDRPISGDEPPVGVAMVSPRGAAGEGVSALILKGGPGGPYEVTLSGDRLPLVLADHGEDVPLLTAKTDQGLAVAALGGREVVVITAGQEGPASVVWTVPEGAVTGLYPASEGLACISTVIGGGSYPETFSERAWEPSGERLLEEHVWFWRGGTWEGRPLVIPGSVVIEGGISHLGDVLLLVLDMSDLQAVEGGRDRGLLTVESGEIGWWWPLQAAPGSGVMHFASTCSNATPMGPVVYTEQEVCAYQVGGGEPSWTFRPSRGQVAGELKAVAVLSDGLAVASERTIFFLDREGEVLSQIVTDSTVVTLFPLPGHPEVFVLMTEERVSVYDAWARRMWSAHLDCSPLAWDTFHPAGESAGVYLSVVTAESLLQFRLDVDP